MHTLAGLIQPTILEDGQVCVDMGEPILEPEQVGSCSCFSSDCAAVCRRVPKHGFSCPDSVENCRNRLIVQVPTTLTANHDSGAVVAQPVVVDGITWTVTTVGMGNPHAVVFRGDGCPLDVDKLDFPRIGPMFENHEVFPARVNTEFTEVRQPSQSLLPQQRPVFYETAPVAAAQRPLSPHAGRVLLPLPWAGGALLLHAVVLFVTVKMFSCAFCFRSSFSCLPRSCPRRT